MKYYLVLDNKDDAAKMSFLNEGNIKIDFLLPKKHITNYFGLMSYCRQILRKTQKGDVIIFWYDFIGIMTALLASVLFKKRHFVILNILLKNKNNFKNRFARMLYKKALKKKDVIATVTSEEYGYILKKRLNIGKDFYLLHDIYNIKSNHSFLERNYVFCGGRNGRDWAFLFELARSMSNVEFHAAMDQKSYEYYPKVPTNVKTYIDISSDEFLSEMGGSRLVVLPLNTDAPAGLLVMFQAAALGKAVISTNTPVTKEYLSCGRGLLCNNDINEWKTALNDYLINEDKRKKSSIEFKSFLDNYCSESYYRNQLFGILNNEVLLK